MEDHQRNLQKIDMICDWTPGLSTITNGAELLYKLATEKKVYKAANKVDTAASSIQPNKKATDLNIHLANKSKLDCFIGMIPIFGNIKNFVRFYRHGLPSSIEHAIEKNNREAILLYFEKYPFSKINKALAPAILEKVAIHCDLELFEKVFFAEGKEGKDKWDLHAVEKALDAITASKNPPPPDSGKKINALLGYCDDFLLTGDLNIREPGKVKEILQKAALYCSDAKLFEKILGRRTLGFTDIAGFLLESVKQVENGANIDVLLAYCEIHFEKVDFGQLKDTILNKLLLPDRDPPSGLTEERMNKIVDLCSSCTLLDFGIYCRDFADKFQRAGIKKTGSLYQTHYSLTKKLLDKTDQDAENPQDPDVWKGFLWGTFEILIQRGEQEICSKVYDKYGNRLPAENKKELLTSINLLNTDDSKETMKELFLRCMKDAGLTDNDLTEEELLNIRDQLAEYVNIPK